MRLILRHHDVAIADARKLHKSSDRLGTSDLLRPFLQCLRLAPVMPTIAAQISKAVENRLSMRF